MFILKKMLVLMLVILVSPFNSNTMAMFGPSLSKTPNNKRYAKVLVKSNNELDIAFCLKINGLGEPAEKAEKIEKKIATMKKVLANPSDYTYYFDDDNEIITNFYSEKEIFELIFDLNIYESEKIDNKNYIKDKDEKKFMDSLGDFYAHKEKYMNIMDNPDVIIEIVSADSFIKNSGNNSERIFLEEPYSITKSIINFLKNIEDKSENKYNSTMGLIIVLSELHKQPKELQNQIETKFTNMMERYAFLIKNKFPKSTKISLNYYCQKEPYLDIRPIVIPNSDSPIQKTFQDLIKNWGKDYFSKTRDGNGDIIKASHEDVNYSKNLIRENSPDFHESEPGCQIF